MKVKVKHFEKDGGILRGWNIKGEPSDKGACKYYIGKLCQILDSPPK